MNAPLRRGISFSVNGLQEKIPKKYLRKLGIGGILNWIDSI